MTAKSTISAVSGTTLTYGSTGSANCTDGFLGNVGAHSDMFQLANANPQADVYYAKNNWGALYAGDQQGMFVEGMGISGGYYGQNTFKSHPSTPQRILAVNGSNELFIMDRNVFAVSKTMSMNEIGGSNYDTVYGDTCPAGGSFLTGGTNIRQKAAAANACYTTTSARCTVAPLITQTGSGVGSTLVMTTGATWTTTPTGHTYGWYVNGALVQANNSTYTVAAGDVGKPISLQDTITSANGPGRCVSNVINL